MGMLSNMSNYSMGGMAMYAGFDPVTNRNGAPGTRYWQYGSGDMMVSNDSRVVGAASAAGLQPRGLLGKVGMVANYAGNIGTVYGGYQLNGVAGAYDALAWDIATNAAVDRFHYLPTAKAGLMTVRPGPFEGVGIASRMVSGVGFVGKFVGAGVGASVGQAAGIGIGNAFAGEGSMFSRTLGTAGAFAGGYAGGALMTRTGLMGMGAAAVMAAPVVAGAAAMYGASQALDAGVAYQRQRRQINTDGAMTAFNTSNAMTMRGRAVAAIQRSHLNARSALGQEASYLHSQRNYFSQYRAG